MKALIIRRRIARAVQLVAGLGVFGGVAALYLGADERDGFFAVGCLATVLVNLGVVLGADVVVDDADDQLRARRVRR